MRSVPYAFPDRVRPGDGGASLSKYTSGFFQLNLAGGSAVSGTGLHKPHASNSPGNKQTPAVSPRQHFILWWGFIFEILVDVSLNKPFHPSSITMIMVIYCSFSEIKPS